MRPIPHAAIVVDRAGFTISPFCEVRICWVREVMTWSMLASVRVVTTGPYAFMVVSRTNSLDTRILARSST